ncbi:MAG: hypothetical protein CVU42_04805 [Chloroflexi bacterium HGW-Chloroflexi-4]|nr:MAG: hypothetical protein CVU42_04805 [Chloroflexi bacterium HGW-Chloroflexi-4]
MNKIILLCCTLGLIFSTAFTHVNAPSAAVTHNQAELAFPMSIAFLIDLKDADSITQVKLHYGTNRDSCGTVSALAYPEFTTGSSINARWEWDMRQSGGEPPGTTIWWQWEYIDNQGKSEFTDRQEILWLDDVYDWKLLEDGLIRFHYYENDKQYASTLKNAAVEALNHLNEDIGMLPEQPVDLYIYSSTQDMRDAVFYEPGWTGGLAYPEYNILIIGIDPAELEWGQNTEAHELTHVLVGDYTFSCLGSTPTWLSEGLAVYGEGGPSSFEAAFFEQNVDSNSLMSFSVLSGGFSEDPSIADLSYSQSFYMVDYLIQTYGKEKMLSLLQRIRAGDAISDALQNAYGFDLAGFQAEWRSYYSLPALDEAAQQNMQNPTPVPTIIPIQGMDSQAVVSDPVSLESTPVALTTQASVSGIGIIDWLRSHLVLILVIAGVNCLLLIVIMLIVRQKGAK